MQAKGEIERDQASGEEKSHPKALEGRWRKDIVDGFDQDADGGSSEDDAFKADGKVSDLSMSVDVFAIWGLGGIPKAEGREAGGEDVDDGFGGIGEQGGAVGHPPRK